MHLEAMDEARVGDEEVAAFADEGDPREGRR